MSAYVPPKERRGLVLVDPSFEDAGDFSRLSKTLDAAHRKWPTGIYMLWYPIKERAAPDALARRLPKRCQSPSVCGPRSCSALPAATPDSSAPA